MSDYLHCDNCKRQVFVEGADDICYWCDELIRKKREVIMTAEREPIPPKVGGLAYYEEHKDAIIADFYGMSTLEMVKRWAMSVSTWTKLKGKWGVKSKRRGQRPKRQNQEPPADEDTGTAPLTEHERYLILLGYQQAIREILWALTK